MYNKRDVVMLPIDKSNMCRIIDLEDNTFKFNIQPNPDAFIDVKDKGFHVEPFHLYILSDEKIKEGDWCYGMDGIFQYKGKVSIPDIELPKKIIATTNKSLNYEESIYDPRSKTGGKWIELPKIPQSFIEHYVSEYNKGNVITEVMVEYNEPCCKCDTTEKVINCKYSVGLEECNAPDPNKDFYGIRPKVDPKDNSINIKPVKDSWSKEELISAFEDFACAVFNENYKSDMSFKKRAELMSKKWIEENL